MSEWLIFVTASLFLATLLFYYIYNEHQSNLSQEKGRLLHSATASEFIIGKQLANISITLDKVRTAVSLGWKLPSNSQQRLQERLGLLGSAMPNVQAMTILNQKGTVIASSNQRIIDKSFSDRNYFHIAKTAPDQKKLYVSPPFKGIFGDWLIAFSKVILDNDGEFAGLVLIFLNAQEYKQSLNALRPTAESWAALAHGDGILFAWEPETMAITGQNLARPDSFFSKHFESGKAASFFSGKVAANNELSLIALRTINPTKLHMNKPLILAVASNTAPLYQGLKRNIYYLSAIFILLNIITGTALYLSQRAHQKSAKIAERAKAHAHKLSQQLTQFFELTPSFMAIADKKGYCQQLNPACEKKLGYPLEYISKQPLSQYIHPDDRAHTLSTIDKLEDGSPHQTLMLRFCNKQGEYRYLEVFVAIQEKTYFIAALDITHRETEKERLQVLAYHDRLTGLANRALFFDRLQQIIAQRSHNKDKMALLYLDLDEFKAVNDTLGHDAGDNVLKTIAQRLTKLVRKTDTVARLGGDEFVIILPQVDSKQDILTVTEKIMASVKQEIILESGETARVGASIGISCYPANGASLHDLLLAADRAMYHSKQQGKNTFTFADTPITIST